MSEAHYFEEREEEKRQKIQSEDKADIMGRLGVALGKSKADHRDEVAAEIASVMTWLEDKKPDQNGGDE